MFAAWGSRLDVRADPALNVTGHDGHDFALFTPDWVRQYDSEHAACEEGKGSYKWLRYGFALNILSEWTRNPTPVASGPQCDVQII